MLSSHPRGLFIVFFISLFERMAYYILFTILVLSINTGYMLDTRASGIIYALFLFGVYGLGILGGMIADKWLGYTRSCIYGLLLMVVGYALMAIPQHSLIFLSIALLVLVVGNGLYKSNMVALLGNFYSSSQFLNKRDEGFNIFYIAINIGALLAPFAAIYAGEYRMHQAGFIFDPQILAKAGNYLSGNMVGLDELKSFIQSHHLPYNENVRLFCSHYQKAVMHGYHFAYAIAAIALVISFAIFYFFRKRFYEIEKLQLKISHHSNAIKSSDKQRVIVLLILMFVIMFFWMSFYQNGFTLTFFANNYTQSIVSRITYLFFDFTSLMMIIGIILSAYFFIIQEKLSRRVLLGILSGIFFILIIWRYGQMETQQSIKAEHFQIFNPLFCIVLTPFLILLFRLLSVKGMEPSTPAKIGIGMLLTAATYMIMIAASIGLPSPGELHNGISPILVSPWWLISLYLATTIAELFMSPIGMSYVSKVAPDHLKGTMQGAWFGAMALGNLLSGIVGALFWTNLQLWQYFILFVIVSLLPACIIFILLKQLKGVSE